MAMSIIAGKENLVCKQKKSLCDLKQPPWCCIERLSEVNRVQTKQDGLLCLCSYSINHEYVDDLILVYCNSRGNPESERKLINDSV